VIAAARAGTALALATGVVVGVACGDDGERVVTTTVYRTVTAPALEAEAVGVPDIARRPAGKGEIVIKGDEAPKTHGPYDFEPGAYDFRYAQYAPGRQVDFATEASSFTAVVTRQPGKTAGDTQVLSNATARAGAGTLNLSGKLYVEVQSADYSYVMRFTPREGS
jgi:hypothetical protein